MKKVKMNVSIASAGWSYYPGQIVDLDDETAQAWDNCGHCTIIEAGEKDDSKSNNTSSNGTPEFGGSKKVSKSR